MVEKAQKEKRKKILVTGSSGMLGSALMKELSGGYNVVGLDIREPAPDTNSDSNGESLCPGSKLPAAQSVSTKLCDITDRISAINTIRLINPGLIIHAAAWTDVDGCEKNPEKAERVNIIGTKNAVNCAQELRIPLIYVSTDFVFDGKKKIPYTEKDRPNPLNIYAKSKLKGEEAVATLEQSVILRTSWLFGSKGKNFVDTILVNAKEKKDLKIVNDQQGSPTYAKDLARAIHALLQKGLSPFHSGEIYHISNTGSVSWFDYAKEILSMSGIGGIKIIPICTGELKRPAKRPAFSVLDSAKFEKVTGSKMHPWKVALKEYLSEKR